MRVLQLQRNRGMAGPMRHVHLLAGALTPHVEVGVATRRGGWLSGQTKATLPSVRLYELPLWGAVRNPIAMVQLCRVVRTEGYDLLHAHGVRSAMYGRLVARICKVPFVITAHSALDRRARFFNAADAVIAVSHGTKEQLIDKGVAPERIRVVWNGIDLAEFGRPSASDLAGLRRELGLPPEALVVATFGRTGARKGHDVFLKAAALIRREAPNAWFLLVGRKTPNFLPVLEKLAQELRLSDRILCTGHRHDIPHLLRLVDVVVLPSRDEPFGIIALEAMACSVPVIASKVGGLQEVVADSETGWTVPVEDAEAVAERVLVLLQDASLREQMGEAGCRRVETYFTAERMATETLAVYRGVMEARAP